MSIVGVSFPDLAEVSLVDCQVKANPYPYFAELVEKAPVLWSSRMQAWLVADYELVSAALRNPDISSDRIQPYLESKIPEEDRERFSRMFEILGRWLVFLGPPDHTRLRGLVHKSFTPRRVRQLKDEADGIATELAQKVKARLDAGETVDLMSEYCNPLPATMIAGLFGVPLEDGYRLKGWAEELGLFINGALGAPERNNRVAKAMAEFEEYLLEQIARYRQEPADNILSGLVEANDNDGTLTEVELLATTMLILDAGYKTVQNALNNSLLMLLQSPEDWERLASDQSVSVSAVEEFLRMVGPGYIVVRRVGKDMEFGGQHLKEGQRVYLLTGAANRDPKVFENPQTLKIDRAENPHLAFGQGIHFCLGASLARMELSAGLEALVREIPCPELAVPTEDLKWHDVLILLGVDALPVRKRSTAA